MASKQHCDICDVTGSDVSDGLHDQRVVMENLQYASLVGETVALEVEFRTARGRYDENTRTRMDLCKACQIKALVLLLKRLGWPPDIDTTDFTGGKYVKGVAR